MISCVSLFSGVGGIDLGFERAGCKTIFANEFDYHAQQTYKLNFPFVHLDDRDIKKINEKEIPKADILLAGFPCQAFSIAGKREGFLDNRGRGDLFFDAIRIAKEMKPRVIFLENVKNLLSHDHGRTFKVITTTLEKLGYHVTYKVLNSCEYGNVPQNRERIYIVAFKYKKDFNKFSFPSQKKLTKTIKDELEKSVDDVFYYTDKCKFYKELQKEIVSPEYLYQWRRKYVRKNVNKLCPTLTANMGTGGHNVPITIDSNGIRKLTPRECFNFQGFPKKFKFPVIANCHLYKQAGNSVTVPVITSIAKQIVKAIGNLEE